MLLDQIRGDMTTAMKAGDKFGVETLRLLVSEISYKQIDLQRDLTDSDVLAVLEKEVKKRREAVEAFKAGGRSEQAQSEEKEMVLLSAYLPKQMTEGEIKAELLKMDLPHDFGQAMRIASPVFKGKADGKVVAELVRSRVS